ncbi:MAG: DNA polymerase III subunit beta [Oscillospiraceae bacterium]|nr:DNA polymerase III subunit beta [Oscillospiraceae bacterium]
MKFSANKNELCEVVSSASKACAVKTALNILDGVLLNLEGDILTVTGYDLEIGIKVSIKVDGTEDGKVVLDPKLFGDMVRKMGKESVDIALVDNKSVKISAGKSKVSLPCKNGEEFPNIIQTKKDDEEQKTFEMESKLLKEMLKSVSYAVSRTKPELEVIKFEIEDNVFYAAGTDANRLAVRHCKVENENVDFMLPEKAANSLLLSLSDSEKEKITLSVNKKQIVVTKENYTLISRLIDGNFVGYRRIINADFNRTMVANVKELINAMELCMLLQSDKLKIPASATFDEGVMKITCKTPYGAIEEQEIQSKIDESEFDDYNEFQINFNARFMHEALSKTTCDEVKFYFEGSLKPIKITPVEDNGDFIAIIVPVRSL